MTDFDKLSMEMLMNKSQYQKYLSQTNPEKHISHEFKSSEIFQASDVMVDALTNILDKERNRRKAS